MLSKIPFTRAWWERMRRAIPQMFDGASALASIQQCIDEDERELST